MRVLDEHGLANSDGMVPMDVVFDTLKLRSHVNNLIFSV